MNIMAENLEVVYYTHCKGWGWPEGSVGDETEDAVRTVGVV